jgi:hypothetical protein
LPGADENDIRREVDAVMDAMGFGDSNRYPYEYDPPPVLPGEGLDDNGDPTSYVTVSLLMQYSDVALVGGFFGWLNFSDLRSSTTLRGEIETTP